MCGEVGGDGVEGFGGETHQWRGLFLVRGGAGGIGIGRYLEIRVRVRGMAKKGRKRVHMRIGTVHCALAGTLTLGVGDGTLEGRGEGREQGGALIGHNARWPRDLSPLQ